MFKHEGVASVYRGFLPTLMGIMPYASISFFTFETLKQQYHVGFSMGIHIHDSAVRNPPYCSHAVAKLGS